MDIVYVTVYEHRHGVDVSVYANEELAIAARAAIALEWWDAEFPGEDQPAPQRIGEDYFEAIEDESFSITRCAVQS